jgi:hypothetical protein
MVKSNNGNRSSLNPLRALIPGGFLWGYGISTISSLSNSGVTLSSAQASKDRLILTGSLTGNINMIFPAWMKSWTIENRCSGNFSVTYKQHPEAALPFQPVELKNCIVMA